MGFEENQAVRGCTHLRYAPSPCPTALRADTPSLTCRHVEGGEGGERGEGHWGVLGDQSGECRGRHGRRSRGVSTFAHIHEVIVEAVRGRRAGTPAREELRMGKRSICPP